jgi:hypothetical protein
MRKGYLLVEILVVLAILVVISIPLNKFIRLLAFDVPKSARRIESNTSLLNLLNCMQFDIVSACRVHTAGKNMLIMQMADETVSYTFSEDKTIRSTTDSNMLPDEWVIPGGRIDFEIQQVNDTPAVSVTKYVEAKTYRGIEKKMEETYLFFPNVFDGAKK